MKKMSLKDYSNFLIKEEDEGEQQQSSGNQEQESQVAENKKLIKYENKEKPTDEKSSLITFLAFDIVDAFLKGQDRTLLMKASIREEGESQEDLKGASGVTQKSGRGISPKAVVDTNKLKSPQQYIDNLDSDIIHRDLKNRLLPFLKNVATACEFLESQNVESIMLEQQENKKVLKFFRVRYTKFVDILFSRGLTQVLNKKNSLNIDQLIKLINKYFSKFTKEIDESEEAKSSRESNEKKAQIFDNFFSRYKERLIKRSKAKTPKAKLESYWRSTFGSPRTYNSILMAINTNSLDFPEFIVNGLKYKKLESGKYSSQIKDVVLIGLFHELFGKTISKENLDRIFQIASKAQGTDNKESAKEEIKEILFGEGLTATGEEVAEVSQAEAEDKIQSQPINTQMSAIEQEEEIDSPEEVNSGDPQDDDPSSKEESDDGNIQYIDAIEDQFLDDLEVNQNTALAVVMTADLFLMLASTTKQLEGTNSILKNSNINDQIDPGAIFKELDTVADKIIEDKNQIPGNGFFRNKSKRFFKHFTELSLKFLIEDAGKTLPIKIDVIKSHFTTIMNSEKIVKIVDIPRNVNISGKKQDFNVEKAYEAIYKKINSIISSKPQEEEKQETSTDLVKFEDSNGDGQSDLNKKANQLAPDQSKKLLGFIKQIKSDIAKKKDKEEVDAIADYLEQSLKDIFKDILNDNTDDLVEIPADDQAQSVDQQIDFIDQIADEIKQDDTDASDADQDEDEDDKIKTLINAERLNIKSDLGSEDLKVLLANQPPNLENFASTHGAFLAAAYAAAVLGNIGEIKSLDDLKSKVGNKFTNQKILFKKIALFYHTDMTDSKHPNHIQADAIFKNISAINDEYKDADDIEFLYEFSSHSGKKIKIEKDALFSFVEGLINQYKDADEVDVLELYNKSRKKLGLQPSANVASTTEDNISPETGMTESLKSDDEKKRDNEENDKLNSELSKLSGSSDSSKDGAKMTYEEWLKTENVVNIDSSNLLAERMELIVDDYDFDEFTAKGYNGELFHEMVIDRIHQSKKFNANALMQAIKRTSNEDKLKVLLAQATDKGKKPLDKKIIDLMIKQIVTTACMDSLQINKISGSITEGVLDIMKKVASSKAFKIGKAFTGLGGGALVLTGLLAGMPITAALGSVSLGAYAGLSIFKRFTNNLDFKKEYKKLQENPIDYISKNFIKNKEVQDRVVKPIVNNLIAYQATICVYEDYANTAALDAIGNRDKSFEAAKSKFDKLSPEKQEKYKKVFNQSFEILGNCPWHELNSIDDSSRVIQQGSINILFNELFFGSNPLSEEIQNKIISEEGAISLSDEEEKIVLKRILEIINDKTTIHSSIVEFVNDDIIRTCGLDQGAFRSIGDFLSRKNRAKFFNEEKQDFNVFKNVNTSLKKTLNSEKYKDLEEKSFLGDQEEERRIREEMYDGVLLGKLSGKYDLDEYNNAYESRQFAESFVKSHKVLKKNKKSLSYLLFEADGDEIKQSQDIEGAVSGAAIQGANSDLGLAVGELILSKGGAGIQYLVSLFTGLVDTSSQAANAASGVASAAGAVGKSMASAQQATTKVQVTYDAFFNSLSSASKVLSSGKDAVSRVIELPNGDKLICYFSNIKGDAAQKMSALFFDASAGKNGAWKMVGRMKEIKESGVANLFDINIADSLKQGKFVLEASSKAMPVNMNQALLDIQDASQNVFGSIVKKVDVGLSNFDTFDLEYDLNDLFSGVKNFISAPADVKSQLLKMSNSILNSGEKVQVTEVIKLSPPDSLAGLKLQVDSVTKTYNVPTTSGGGASKSATPDSSVGKGNIEVPPIKIPEWLSTAKNVAMYTGLTNAVHAAYSRLNFKAIRGGIFGRLFFEKYKPQKIIAIDVLDSLRGAAPVSLRSSDPTKLLPSYEKLDGLDEPFTNLGLPDPEPSPKPGMDGGAESVAGLEYRESFVNKPSKESKKKETISSGVFRSNKNRISEKSYVHNISLKDFLFENKVTKRKRRR